MTYDDRLHPATVARGRRTSSRCGRSGWTSQNGSLPGLRRRSRARARRASYTYPDDGREPYGGGPARTSGPSTATACSSRPPATCTPAACTTTCGSRRARAPAARRRRRKAQGRRSRHGDTAHLFRRGQVLRAGRRGVLGRRHDGHAAGLAACRLRRATCSGPARPTTRSAARGTSRWGSWSSTWPTARRARPVHDQGRREGQADPRPPGRERQPRRRRRPPARPAQAADGRRPATAIEIHDFVYAPRRHEPRADAAARR